MGKLSAKSVQHAKPGRHGDGAGLYLLVKPSGAKSWLLRVQKDGKRRDIGLGSLAACSLAEAREKAAELRKHALNGRDPVVERDRDNRSTPTFKEATTATHGALKSGWVEKNAAAFLTSLETYAYPKLGSLKVDAIEASDILSVLAPIWTTKPELARKVRMRIGQVLNFSHSKGWRPTEAPSRAVTVGLPRQPKGGNFAAMPYAEVPAFVRELQAGAPTNGRRALLLLIFTAARYNGGIRTKVGFIRYEGTWASGKMVVENPALGGNIGRSDYSGGRGLTGKSAVDLSGSRVWIRGEDGIYFKGGGGVDPLWETQEANSNLNVAHRHRNLEGDVVYELKSSGHIKFGANQQATLAKWWFQETPLVFGTVAAGDYEDVLVTVTGVANARTSIQVTPQGHPGNGLIYNVYTNGANSVRVRLFNPTGADIASVDRTWNIEVREYAA